MRSKISVFIRLCLVMTCFLLSMIRAYGQVRSNTFVQSAFGNIPDSLFNMQHYSLDPQAPFFYSLKEVSIHFDTDDQSIIAILDYHVRVKVFDASVHEASIVAIPYYFSKDIEQLKNIKAVTYSPGGTATALSTDNIRTININARYNVKEFTMPNVEDGSVLEYSYRIRRRYIDELPDFYLAHQVPTARAQVKITYPSYLRYKVIPENYKGVVSHHTQRIDTSTVAKVFTVPQPAPILQETWVATDVPAVQKEAFISSLNDYRGKLKFKLSEFGRPRQKLENSWDLVIAELRQNQNVLKAAAKNHMSKEIGASIAGKLQDPVAVQDSIFRYVEATSNYNGAQSPYSETPDTLVLAGKAVDQAAINQTLLAMLEGAGIEAYPILISTREFGQINKSFPSFFQFNGQLVYSVIDGKEYFMDASFNYSRPNLIPVTTYNETGLLLKTDSYEWKEIKPVKSVFAISITLKAALDRRGNLKGSVHAQSSGYPAQLIRQKYANGKNADAIIREAIFDGYSTAVFSGSEIKNRTDYTEPIIFDTNFEIQNYATSFTDGLKFRPMVVGYLMSNPFNQTNRKLPVTLDAPEKLNLVYEVTVPPDYTVPQGEQNRSIKLPGASLAEFYDMRGRTLKYTFNIDISKKQFEPEVYPQLLNLYQRWVTLSNSTWLIKKK